MKQFEVHDLAGLDAVAEALLPLTEATPVVCFFGSMGAGKTTLIKVFCKLVGVKEEVSSPTFALVNEYQAHEQPVFHFDFYRIDSEIEALDMGYEEYFYSGNRCLVEWPEKIPNLLPEHFVSVTIEHKGEARIIQLKG